jgi:hypothetical protein
MTLEVTQTCHWLSHQDLNCADSNRDWILNGALHGSLTGQGIMMLDPLSSTLLQLLKVFMCFPVIGNWNQRDFEDYSSFLSFRR